jgi:Family of unknown function (DUF6318)
VTTVTRRRWTLRFAACLGVLTVLISGCTEKQQANETLPSASKTSTSESQEKLPPLGPEDFPMPEEARTKDAAGAEAFIRYYLDLYNWTKGNQDTTFFRSLARGCETCDRLSDQLDEATAAGATYRGGDVRVDAISTPLVRGNESQAAFRITETALAVMGRNGQPLQGRSFPERTSNSCGAILTWSSNTSTWLVKQLDVS